MSGSIVVDWELWRATIDNAMIEDITEVLTGGTVSLNHDRTIPAEASISVSDVSRISPYADYLALFLGIEREGEPRTRHQLGLYTTRVPPSTRTVERSDGTYAGSDLTSVLASHALTDTRNIGGGTLYTDAVADIIDLAGISRYSVLPSPKQLAGDGSIQLGTTLLDAANRLLEAIGYYHLTATPDGTLVSGPMRAIAYVEPYRRIGADDLGAPVETQPTDTTVANIVIVVKDDPGGDILSAIRRNDAADSPTSTVSIGPRTRVETRADLADQDAVDALAERLLSEGRTFYQTATLNLLPDPGLLLPHQTIELAGDGELAMLNGRWWVRTVSMGLTPATASALVEVNRVTDAIEGAII